MSTTLVENEAITGIAPLVLQLKPAINLSDDELLHFCRINRELRIERNAQGELIIMAPCGGDSSERESEIIMQLRIWAKKDGTGTTFSSNGGFCLPNGAMRAPDTSWVSYARLNQFTAEERSKFLPICPEFVIELRSASDRLTDVQAKMQEYIANGARLGLLIDPAAKRVHIYRPNQAVEVLENPDVVSCNELLPGFELIVSELW